MALIKCNECGKEISDKTTNCPNCGCPINEKVEVKTEKTEATTSVNEENKINEKEKKPIYKKTWFIISAITIVVGGLIIGIVVTLINNINKYVVKNSNTEMSVSSQVEKVNSFEELNETISNDVKSSISNLKNEYKQLTTDIDTYDKYSKNVDKVEAFYDKTYETTKNLCIKLREYSIYYAEFIMSSNKSNDDKYDDFDELYDCIYDDMGDEIYDEIYDGMLEQMYDNFYDGIIDDAYDNVEYSEWSKTSSNEYKLWSKTSSDVYEEWSDLLSDVYEFYSDISSELLDDDTEKANKVIKEFKEELEELKNNVKNNDSENLENVENTENNDTTIESSQNTESNENSSESSQNTELVEGMRPEFKKAMDSYEEFMNEYCDFMKKYNESSGSDLSLLSDYSTYISKYYDFVIDFEKWNSDEDMNTKEAAYYLDVQTRVNKKLVELSQ